MSLPTPGILPDDGPHESFALPPGATESYITTNGVRLHCVAAGDSGGPLVVLLHGFPEFWYSWRQVLPALSEHCHMVAPDLRGYNLSDKPRRGYDLPSLCADVAGLVQALGARDALVVGHDWGGVIAWEFAMSYPALTRRLAILNAPHPAALLRELRNPRQLRRSLYAFFFLLPWLPEWTLARHQYARVRRLFQAGGAHGPGLTPEEVGRYVAAIARPGALTAALNYYRELGRRGPLALRPARRIAAPTLVLWGERDQALGVELLDGLDRWVTNLRIQRFPTAGHWLAQQRPAEVSAALLEFLVGV
jgi:pimeloyl-ACP methyl ester carboxylesterase